MFHQTIQGSRGTSIYPVETSNAHCHLQAALGYPANINILLYFIVYIYILYYIIYSQLVWITISMYQINGNMFKISLSFIQYQYIDD